MTSPNLKASSKVLEQLLNLQAEQEADAERPPVPLYFDYNATTPLAPEVSLSMAGLLVAGVQPNRVLDPTATRFGNPSSSHVFGGAAKQALEKARSQVARCINCESSDNIIFTSGGTESINHALCGVGLWAREMQSLKAGKLEWTNHIVTSSIEHVAVSETVDYMCKQFGFRKTIVDVNEFGQVNPADVLDACTDRTALITIMLANNEVGTLQPLREIVEQCKSEYPKVLVHTDASQAVGKIPVDVQELGVDLLTLAGHKLYGPKGAGALYVGPLAQGRMHRVMHGANHESGRRAGTENVLLAIGLGTACELVTQQIMEEVEHLAGLRDQLQLLLEKECELWGIKCSINGHPELRLPNTLSIGFDGMTANDILRRISSQLSCSAGAACHSVSVEAKTGESKKSVKEKVSISHVLRAMKVPECFAKGTLRLSVGRFTTPDDVARATAAISSALRNAKAEREQNQDSEERKVSGVKPTELEYFDDTYRFESEADVVQVQPDDRDLDDKRPGQNNLVGFPRYAVVLNRTVLHPQGGGQPSDSGEIQCKVTGVIFNVEFVEKTAAGIVLHYGWFQGDGVSGGDPFSQGTRVALKVDRRRRELNARVHSAGHLIDVAMLQCGITLRATKGCHFPDIGPSVDYEGVIPAEERGPLKEALEERVNNLIQQGIPTKVAQMIPEEARKLCMDGQAPVGSDDQLFRIVVVGGDKGCPCGGTHVKNTREIKAINIKKIAKKGNSMRISYKVPE